MGRAEQGQATGWSANRFEGPHPASRYIKEPSLFVCLFGFGAQTTGWIPTKCGMDLSLDPVGNLKINFWVDPPRGDIILGKKLSPYGPGRREESFYGTF